MVGVSPPAALPDIPLLPPLPAGFVGRAEALAWLQDAATEAPTRVVGLSGPPGAGKTALAIVAARQLAPVFPGAQFFIDLDDLGPSPSPGAVMAQVIWSLQPQAVLPENQARLPEAYRSLLKGRRVLLVLDGVPSLPAWAALAPPQGCLLLVGQPGLPAQAELALEPLPEGEAEQLLRGLSPRIGPAAAELAALCGRLPLALRLAAAALSAGSALVTSGYLGRMLDEQAASKVVDPALAALAVSARLLPPETARLWQTLSVFPASFAPPAAAAVGDLTPEAAQNALDVLLGLSLLEPDRHAGRYRLHPLVRQFAARRLPVGEREPARQRHAVHYRDVLAAANETAVANETDVANATAEADETAAADGGGLLGGLRRFDLERANVRAGQAWAAARAGESLFASRLASDYAAAGARLLPLRQSSFGRLGWLETARSAAQQLGDHDAEGSHLDQLGRLHRRAANPRRAIGIYERRLRIARDSGDREAEGEALGRLGLTYMELGQAQPALDHSRQALEIARELDNRRDEALTSWNMGLAYEALGDLPNAVAAMQRCVDYEREIHHPDAEDDAVEVEELRRRAA